MKPTHHLTRHSRSASPRLRHAVVVAFGVALVVLAGTAALAHPATERYIPIGYWQSIGVGGTYLGPLVSVGPLAESMRFRENGVEQTVRITDRTRIYIDRSHLGEPNLLGTRNDLRAGVTAEIRMSTADPGAAAWIKIRGER